MVEPKLLAKSKTKKQKEKGIFSTKKSFISHICLFFCLFFYLFQLRSGSEIGDVVSEFSSGKRKFLHRDLLTAKL